MKRSAIVVAALSLWASIACAADPKPFTQQSFDALSHEGKPVVVGVHADWCPVCKAQKPIIENLSKQPAYKDVAVLTLNYDTDKAALKQFRVNKQSTLIAFKGGKETGRSLGQTKPAAIEDIFKKAAN